VSHPTKTKLIAEARRIKTDRIDSHALAELLGKDWTPFPNHTCQTKKLLISKKWSEEGGGGAIPRKRKIQIQGKD
jgi:hypothetical protein